MLSWVKFGPQLETMLSTIGDGIKMHAVSSLVASQENIRCDVDENLARQTAAFGRPGG